jgi:capsular exopolysaccharide synthesis family protein
VRDGLGVLLWRHWGLLASCVAISLLGGAAYTLLTTPVFQATSTLRFELEELNLPQLVQQLSTENRVSTEIEVLQGRTAAEVVIDSLGLRAKILEPRRARAAALFSVLRVAPDADTATLVFQRAVGRAFSIHPAGRPDFATMARPGQPVTVGGLTLQVRAEALETPLWRVRVVSREAALREFRAALTVFRPVRDADLLAIQFRASDSIQAAAGANLLAYHVIAGRQGVQRARIASTVAYLSDQLDTLGRRLRARERALSGYRQRVGAVDLEEQARSEVGRLVRIEAERGSLEAERQALEALLVQSAQDTGPAPSRRLISFPTLFRNQAAASLLASLAEVENQRSQLAIRRTEADPDLQVLDARIRSLDAQLRGIAETYLAGLRNQIAGLDNVSRTFGTRLERLPEHAVQTARLEREIHVDQELYTLFQTRLKEAEITAVVADPAVRVVDRAVVPERPVKPKPLVNMTLALLVGTLLGGAASLGREWTDRSVRSRKHALLATGVPVLGAVPRLDKGLRGVLRGARSRRRLSPPGAAAHPTFRRAGGSRLSARLVTRPETPLAYTEAFNQLHATLSLHETQAPRVVVVTSSLPGEGKTLTAVNLALTVAARGPRVLLIDADLRLGRVHEVLGCTRSPGFAEFLNGQVRLEEATRLIPVADGGTLLAMPCGKPLSHTGHLLAVERIREILGTLSTQFDLVLIDSPPVNLLADATVLGSVADAVLVVVRAGYTSVDALRFAVGQLASVRANVIGTLLNDIDLRRHGYDDGSYRYIAEVARYYSAAESRELD